MIVGDSGEAGACRQYAKASGVSDEVVVYGEADYGDVPKLMACMDIGLSILRQAERGNSEQKVRQYLATGLCVVGTSGSNDFLEGQGFARIVQTGEPREVVHAVRQFLEQSVEDLTVLAQEARCYAESNLSITARTEQRIQIWNEAAQGI